MKLLSKSDGFGDMSEGCAGKSDGLDGKSAGFVGESCGTGSWCVALCCSVLQCGVW